MYICADENKFSKVVSARQHWPNDLISRGTRVPGVQLELNIISQCTRISGLEAGETRQVHRDR